MTSRRWSLLAGSLLAMVVLLVGAASAPASPSDSSNVPTFKHVFVIMMENTGIEALLGNPNAPWINQAVQKYGVAANYYGVTHPSQPNYIAATSGRPTASPTTTTSPINVPNIVDQLESHGKTWKAYMQSHSLCTTKLDHACGNQLYERKHNPFVSYTDVSPTPPGWRSSSTSASSRPISRRTTSRTTLWISPDQCNDMHGRGGGGPPIRATSRTSSR